MRTNSLMARRELAPATAMRVIRILLIEDCKSDAFLLERMLEDASVNCFYDITNVPRLVDAFYKVDKEQFDVVLLDLNLLDIDGVASVAALHAQISELPIIVYSGTDDTKVKEKAIMCGAMHYMVKGKESGFGLKYMIERAIAQ